MRVSEIAALCMEDLPGSVAVVMGTTTTHGLLQTHTKAYEDPGSGRIQTLGQEIRLLIATGTLPEVKKGSGLTADGVHYHVSQVLLRRDGTTEILLEIP